MNQWTINTQYSGPNRQEQQKTAVSPSYAPTEPGPALQLFYAHRNGLDELFMVVSAAQRITQVTFSGAGFNQEGAGVAYYEQLGATELKYELTGNLLTSIRDFAGKLELTLTDDTGATYDYVIPAANSASVIAEVARPASGNRFIVPGVFLGVFLLGVGLIGFGAEEAAGPPVVPAPTLAVVPSAAPGAAAGPAVSAELYQWALNCGKIEFLTSARGREPFAEEIIKRMETDLAFCRAAGQVRVACAAVNCGWKFHAITEYSTQRLNEFYQKHPSLTAQLTLAADQKFISRAAPVPRTGQAEEAPVAPAPAADAETLPTEAEVLAALEREVLGGILNNQNLRGAGRTDFDSRRHVSVPAAAPTIPPARKTPPAPQTYSFDELDRGAQVQLTYSCPAGVWDIKFVWGTFALPTHLDLELTWPDGEITTQAAQGGPAGLQFITGARVTQQFQKFSDGLLFVHINYDHNYHWDLEEISSNKQIPGC